MRRIFVLLAALVVISGFSTVQTPASAKDNDIKQKVFVHYPKNPGRPAPVSNCSLTTDDQVDSWGWAGWQMPAAGMNYKINLATKPKNLTEADISSAIVNSFSAWSDADSKQIFTASGTTTVKSAKLDGTNAILWKGISGSALAITYVWYYSATGQLVEADTAFNKNYKWSVTSPSAGDCSGTAGTYDVRNIGTHEFGHWVGLDDLYSASDKDLTMYGYGETTELKKDSLGRGDITGVNSIAP